MPVLGHALCGWATALSVRQPGAERLSEAKAALWAPTLIGMAYLPDLVSVLVEAAGHPEGRVLGHSLLVAPLAALVLTPGLARFPFRTRGQAFLVTLFSILLHDLLDLLQSTDRMPLWPLSQRLVRLDTPVIPAGARAEAVVFTLTFLAFVALRRRLLAAAPGTAARPRGRGSLGWALVALAMAGAGGLHLLRRAREDAYEHARSLLSEQRYAETLETLAQARRWPGVRTPGRIDHLEGEAFVGLGDREHAEARLISALQADPDHFWALADLAELYASAEQPRPARRARLEPYLRRLRTDFADDPDLPVVLARIEDELNRHGTPSP